MGNRSITIVRALGTRGEYQWIRTWWTALHLLEHDRYRGRRGIGARWVLRALGEAAMKTGSRYVAFGSGPYPLQQDWTTPPSPSTSAPYGRNRTR